jgi:hypothetical protein
MSIISALRRQETLKFKATLEYLVRVYLKKEIKEPGMVSHTCILAIQEVEIWKIVV